MILTNYWWLLLWLVFAGGFLAMKMPRQPVQMMGKIEYRWSMTSVLLLACPYVIWAMNRSNFGDTEVYRKIFHDIPDTWSQLVVYLQKHTKDQGFSVLTFFLKILAGNSDKIFFLVIAAFQIFCVVYFFRKYSTNFLLSMFMFVASTDYLSWMFNGIRQFLAVCMILISFELILKRKYMPMIGMILFASTIHGSALIMLPIIFIVQGKAWNKRTLLMLAGIVAAVLFTDPFINIINSMLAETQYSDLMTNEIWMNDDGTNVMRVLFYSIPAILSLIGKRYVDEADSPVVNICVNCAACTSFLYILSAFTSGIYIGRIPVYTTLPGYVAVPWLIDHTFTKDSAKMMKVGLICGFLAFFYYQIYVAWGVQF